MICWPPGPFPPTDELRADGCDVGGLLLDLLYTRAAFTEQLRAELHRGLAAAVEQQDWAHGANLLQAFVDSWPVGALVQGARQAWVTSGDPTGLSVLSRAAQIICLAKGWSPLGQGPWPMPCADWVRSHVPSGLSGVGRRGFDDGADQLATLLGVSVSAEAAWVLPPVAHVCSEDVAAQRVELAGRLVREEIAAVVVSGACSEPEAQLALGEIRMEGRAQAALEALGSAGLVAPDCPAFRELLGSPSAGRAGGALDATCDGILLPGPVTAMAQGAPQTVGWLLWDGPYTPVAVHPAAVQVLHAVEEAHDVSAIAALLGAPAEVVQGLVQELIGLGALTGDAVA